MIYRSSLFVSIIVILDNKLKYHLQYELFRLLSLCK
uniref:Uncharacterized protein n=1 Tax=Myoviridae sp. ct0jJ30 TaxID=2825014 RepID=A0A8S5PHH6_9CAUD|nr:MAG TPA: hypothetical protein [Myoviridae sp. ct0jJ30]